MVHQYDYDAFGRETEDDVTSLGLTDENVDGTVQAIVTAYTDSGQTASITSYAADSRRRQPNHVLPGHLGQRQPKPAIALCGGRRRP